MPTIKVHTYIPDDFVDLGEAGEHPIQFKAMIEWAGFESRTIVRITEARAHLSFPNTDVIQKIDLLPRLREYPDTLRRWEDEIRRDWERKCEEKEGA